jgi:hypothetical protein
MSGARIVVLGLMSRHPVAGIVWLTMQHVAGLARLGHDVYYVETSSGDAAFVAREMERFGLPGRWAIDRRAYEGESDGLSIRRLADVFRSADLVINLNGSTKATDEHRANGRLVYVETDPVKLELDASQSAAGTKAYLEPHHAFFTWGENYGERDCLVPIPDWLVFKPTRQPVLLDAWQADGIAPGDAFTTVGNWRQEHRDAVVNGVTYSWSKHHEFLKLIDLPRRTGAAFELALSSYTDGDRDHLEANGWRVRDAADVSSSPEDYRQYIVASRGEFSVAKDMNVRLRSGWIGDRSPTYLAAGRPVILQDTGFSNVLPTGQGLLAFTGPDDAAAAVEAVTADYEKHSRAARELAQEYFAHDVVLPRLLADAGL